MEDRYAYTQVAPVIDERLAYKHSLHHDIMMIVLMLFAFYCAMNIITAILIVIPVFLSPAFSNLIQESMQGSIAIDELYDQLLSLTQGNSFQSFASAAVIIAEAVSLPLFLPVSGRKMFTTNVVSSREKMHPLTFIQVLVIALGAQFIFSVLSIMLNLLLEKIGASSTDTYSAAMESMMNVPGYIYIVLLGPIMEELVFRSAIMKKLERYGANFAIVMSAMLFACYHIFFVQALFAFPVGILLGYVAHKYSVKWSMLMHILYNSAAMLIGVILPDESLQFMLFAGIFVLAIVLLLLNLNTIREQLSVGKSAQTGTFGIAFSGASVIIFLVCVALLSFVTML
jgi:membrane protease YdiL (CAAX protease family)